MNINAIHRVSEKGDWDWGWYVTKRCGGEICFDTEATPLAMVVYRRKKKHVTIEDTGGYTKRMWHSSEVLEWEDGISAKKNNEMRRIDRRTDRDTNKEGQFARREHI